MKKTNTNKVNAVAEQAKANNKTKATAAQTKTNNNAKQLTVKPYDDVPVTIENKTLGSLKSWAYHTYRDLSEDYLYFDRAYAKGMGYTEDELNSMIADARLILGLCDPYTDDRYSVTGANVFESCIGIINICKAYINALHESIKPAKSSHISVVKTMSEGLKYTETDEYDDF